MCGLHNVGAVLAVHAETVRLFLHVLAATIWVGGQLVLGGLVPALRRVGPKATQAAARQFGRIAWPAFVVLIGTGVWNVIEVNDDGELVGDYRTTLNIKLGLVVVSGIAAFLHQRASDRRAMAIWGAISGLAALAVLFFGIVLVSHG